MSGLSRKFRAASSKAVTPLETTLVYKGNVVSHKLSVRLTYHKWKFLAMSVGKFSIIFFKAMNFSFTKLEDPKLRILSKADNIFSRIGFERVSKIARLFFGGKWLSLIMLRYGRTNDLEM